MIFILILCLFIIQIDLTFLTYTLYQTDDICQENWQGSICLPSFSLKYFDKPVSINVQLNKQNLCPSETLVYIRTKQCIYCSKNFDDIHCQHRRVRRMTPTKQEYLHRNSIAIIALSLFALFMIGTLFTLLIIKRSQAHTNLLELLQPNSNIQSIKVPNNRIKSKPMHLTVPQSVKPIK